MAVLKDLPRRYTGHAGEIVRIQEIQTNVYEVWILHEERTDIVTYMATVSPECQVQVKVASERSTSGQLDR